MRIITNKTVGGTNLPRLEEEQQDLYIGSPMAVIGLWVYAVRSRFIDNANTPLPWVWTDSALNYEDEDGSIRPDGVPTKLLIESAYNVEKSERNYRPAIYVGRGGNSMQAIKQSVNNFVGVHRPTRYQGFHCMVSMPLLFECESDNSAESSAIGETVWGFILATRHIFRESFGFHEIEEPILSDTSPSKVNKEVWTTSVQTRVSFDMRWTTIPRAEKLREMVLDLQEREKPEEVYRDITYRDGMD